MITKILLFSCLLYAIVATDNDEMTPEKLNELFDSMFLKQMKGLQNLTFEYSDDFVQSFLIKYGSTDLNVMLKQKKNYFADDIITYITRNATNENLSVNGTAEFFNRKESGNIEVIGTFNGEKVNEKGKLVLTWDKLNLKIGAEFDRSSNHLSRGTIGFYCKNPSVKIEEAKILNEQIDKKEMYKAIYKSVEENWKEDIKKIYHGDLNFFSEQMPFEGCSI